MVLPKTLSGKICFQTNLLEPMNRKGKGKVGWFFFIHHLSEARRKFLQVFSWKIYHEKQGWKHPRNICNLTTSHSTISPFIIWICLRWKLWGGGCIYLISGWFRQEVNPNPLHHTFKQEPSSCTSSFCVGVGLAAIWAATQYLLRKADQVYCFPGVKMLMLELTNFLWNAYITLPGKLSQF